MSIIFLPILLFDIDGVLVNPLGYRLGVQAVQQEFAQRWGFYGRLAGEEEIALLEARQITSEWDQIPICLACLLEEGLARFPGVQADFSLDSVPPELFADNSTSDPVDYRRRILAIGALPKFSGALSDQLLQSDAIFPNLFHYNAYRDLFGHTRDVRRSSTTCRFQQLELGSKVFAETYHLPVDRESEGLLLTSDVSLIPADLAQDLLERRKKGEFAMAAISARPSRPDELPGDEEHNYSPEAELGLQVAGMSEIPCIGFGELTWLAEKVHVHADDLIKPNRIHALAGIAAAQEVDSLSAMQAAYLLDHARTKEDAKALDAKIMRPVAVHIFEDTPVGVLAVQAAVQRLNELGIPAVYRAWGITENSDKRAALTATGAQVFSSIREAIQVAMGERKD